MASHDPEYQSGIFAARAAIAELRALLPESIRQADLTSHSRLPLKVQSARELAAYRSLDLAESACLLFEAGRAIAAIIVARASLESVAWLITLSCRVRAATDAPSLNTIVDRTHRLLFGTRAIPGMADSLNVLTVVDEACDEYPEFRRLYDYFSESTHPAALGTVLSYARLRETDQRQVFDAAVQLRVGRKYPAILRLALQMGHLAYGELETALPTLAALCDSLHDSA